MASGRPFKKGETPPVGKPLAKGFDWRRELAKGKSGRKPDEFKALCRELASRDDTMNAIVGILSDPSHPHFLSALRWASEHGYGKPAQPVTGADGEGPVAHEITITRRIVDPESSQG